MSTSASPLQKQSWIGTTTHLLSGPLQNKFVNPWPKSKHYLTSVVHQILCIIFKALHDLTLLNLNSLPHSYNDIFRSLRDPCFIQLTPGEVLCTCGSFSLNTFPNPLSHPSLPVYLLFIPPKVTFSEKCLLTAVCPKGHVLWWLTSVELYLCYFDCFI